MTSEESEDEYQLVLPFIVCESNGGDLDDQSFTVGFELGCINIELHYASASPAGKILPPPRYVHSGGVAQLDLIAMQHGYTIENSGEDLSGEWTWVVFRAADDHE